MSSLHSQHTFHIPVMGTGFTVDTPLRVARYGISSVISLVDDTLIEEMRRAYAAEYGQPFTPIQKYDEDWRARRITEYLNLVDRIVRQQFEALRASEFAPGSEITRYFELLPESAPLKRLYVRMQSTDGQEKARIQASLRTQIVPGWINVNIMTKLDRANVDRMCEPLPEIYSDALSALRGYANSTLASGIVLSAGLNRRLYAYFSEFPDFFADETGWIRKQIILKVSDYRSAVIQGKFFAKKGLWVSEYRMESGLNCGGHAFAGNGNLIGPVLAELSSKRQELGDELSRLCLESLKAQGKTVPAALVPFRVTAQGGIGTAAEDALLRRLYRIDSTGWGTPFLLVPEATQVEPDTLLKLQQAKEHDVYLSDVSPLGVPFHNLRVSQSELNKQQLIEDGNSGSACPLGHLVSNTEFTEQPICTASRQYQALKLAELKALSLSPEELAEQTRRVMAKACICSDLGDTAYVLKGIPKTGGAFPAVCPGPNIAYYDRVASLREMVDHIYGRGNLIRRTDRPHMFIKELNLNIDFLFNLIRETNAGTGNSKDSDIEEFRVNLDTGIDYYTELMPSLTEESPPARTHMLVQLEACRQRLSAVMATLLEAPLRRKPIRIPARKPVAAEPLYPPADLPGTGGESLTLLVASHTGNGRNFARQVTALAHQAGIRVRTVNMGSYPPAALAGEKNLIAIISTYGEGDPPVAAEVLFDYLKRPEAARLDPLRYSVLALGDKSYIHFCKAGADLDRMLEALGGHRLVDRVDCDVDFHADASRWISGVVDALAPHKDGEPGRHFQLAAPEDEGYSAKHPYVATVLSKINLNGPGSTKETYHIELAVEGAGMEYHPGDACGVVSQNSEILVGKILSALQLTGRTVPSSDLPLEDVLKGMELTVLVPSVIAQHNTFARSRALEEILADDVRLKAFIHGRDFMDLVKEYPVAYAPEDLLKVLRPAPPRLFSITSSQVCHPGRLDLLVGALRYASQGRARQGMASTYLADRIRVGDRIPIFIRPNDGFRMAQDPKVPIIMVGAGTGVAPFRAFLQQRSLLPRSEPVGTSWLFFGNPHVATDFLFQKEWNGHLKSGVLTHLTTAFSRDQQEKVYVHHRILEHASEVYAWLEAGAVVYVSGAKAMAHDVFTALVECARRRGRLSADEASAYGKQLRRSGHYLEDVYS